MHPALRGTFGYRVSRTNTLQVFPILKVKSGVIVRVCNYHLPSHPSPNRLFLSRTNSLVLKRDYGMLVARAIKGALKLRYLLLGGAVGGGYTLREKYRAWKESLPDLTWVKGYMPSDEQINAFKGSVISLKDKIKEVEVDQRVLSMGDEKWKELQTWLGKKIDDAYAAAEAHDQGVLSMGDEKLKELQTWLSKKVDDAYAAAEVHGSQGRENLSEVMTLLRTIYEGASNEVTVKALPFSSETRQTDSAQKRAEALQQELIEVQIRYQKELERLEKDNKELKKQILLSKSPRASSKLIKKSLIDMYSEVLDELSDYDTSYSAQDHLPRVVVVGDQSSGKTSVLEMIAQARIFPRGAGEMMTRAPVKVTLSEGPYHIAQFKNSDREFDLTDEKDLAKLRTEVELRMKRSLRKGKSVSNEVIAMTVKGPGLPRMVLVDLPGIISTVTREMAEDTRECIRQMTEHHMSNPNAIILCIQDGSVDAERSNVTDLVTQVDPSGKRTIFVLTKVDMAEENLTDPTRIKKILAGKLFPMKALGYFAVVTGRGRKDDSIQDIKQYEEQFFRNSKIFRDNLLSSTQFTTRNLSLAVAECFWKMVRGAVEQQADAFKATRYNLETEWKNTYPRLRELDRDELFEKARSEILDEVVNLSQVTVQEWESLLTQKLWDKMSNYVFEAIYLPAAQTGNPKKFNTTVDIRLKAWADSQLAHTSIEAGSEALQHEFIQFMEKSMKGKSSDNLFDPLKEAVVKEALQRHTWETKGSDVLRMNQLNTLEDNCVSSKQQWDDAVKFLEHTIKERLEMTEMVLKELVGPSTVDKWVHWKYTTEQQRLNANIKNELEKLIFSDYHHSPVLTSDEVTTVRKNLQRNGNEVPIEVVKGVWGPVYRRYFLKQSLARTYECRKAFFLYQQGLESDVDCNDVVLFWKIQQVLKTTSTSLRQQVMSREARRLDKIVKEVLDDYSQDSDKKVELLKGRRVQLAEDLKRVRRIQEKLEDFIQALNKEK